LEKYRQEWERLGEYDVQIEQLTKELERLKNALEKHRERNQKLKELEKVEEEIKTLEEAIRNLTQRIDRGEKYIKELREKIEDLEDKQKRLLELNRHKREGKLPYSLSCGTHKGTPKGGRPLPSVWQCNCPATFHRALREL
jgi:septal ring factor EnvC (AmiA/AmiB activator)